MNLESVSALPVKDDTRQGTISITHPVFVNYTQSSQWRDKSHHRAAQSFDSGHYRRKNQKIPLKPRPSPLSTKAEDDDERMEAAALMSRLSTPSSLLTLLGAARRDPFDTYCVSNLPVYVHEVLDHEVSHQWNVFADSQSQVALQTLKHDLMGCAMNTPVAFYTIVFAAATHCAFRHGVHSISKANDFLRLSYKAKAIKLMIEEVKASHGVVSDQVLMSVVTMAAHGTDPWGIAKLEETGDALPLATIQDFHYYGSMQCEWAHLRALHYLVQQRGGLKEIRLAGVGNAIALFDIFTSSITLSAPIFPLVVPTQTTMKSWTHKKDSAAEELSKTLASGYSELKHAEWKDIHPWDNLFVVINVMRDITVAYDHYHRGEGECPKLGHIVISGNSVQHDLLSLPHLSTNNSSEDNCIFEVCRLATLIFSDMVLFPLPPSTGARGKLAHGLMRPLGCCRLLSSWERYPSLLLWATILGGIAVKEPQKRTWFTRQLSNAVIKQSVSAWPLVKDIVSKFLWLRVVCDKPAAEFWNEACQLSPQAAKRERDLGRVTTHKIQNTVKQIYM